MKLLVDVGFLTLAYHFSDHRRISHYHYFQTLDISLYKGVYFNFEDQLTCADSCLDPGVILSREQEIFVALAFIFRQDESANSRKEITACTRH
jgi:hypothetical protein